MLLTLDISTTQTGYAVGGFTTRPRWGVFRPGSMPIDERMAYIAKGVGQMAKAMGVRQVIAEAVSVGSYTKEDGTKSSGNFTSAVKLAEAHGAIKYELRNYGLRLETYNLSSARKALGIRVELGIKGAPKKEHVKQWLINQGLPIVNGDEGDALVLWLAVRLGKTGLPFTGPKFLLTPPPR